MLPPSEKANFGRIRAILFFTLVFLLSIGLLYIVRPFFYPIFWAAVIAILFYPIHHALSRVIRFPNICALISVIISLVIIATPLSIISLLLFNQSMSLYHAFANGEITLDFARLMAKFRGSLLAPYLADWQNQLTGYATDATRTFALFLFKNIKNITQDSVRFVFLLFIMAYTLFYFFKDGEKILKRLQYLSPIGDNHEETLYERFTSTVRATLKGTFIIGSIQGFIGYLLFLITGVQGALIWAVAMFALSIIPGLGAFLVWLPAGILMLALGNLWQAVTIFLVGAFVISTIDNILRPPLVGKDTQMHPLLVLLSTLGGIFIFGVPGMIIGPIIAALYLSIMTIYDNYYLRELKHNEE